MLRNLLILAACAAVVVLPFAARPRDAAPAPSERDGLTLVVISPHNEAIRREFGAAFSAWHQRRHGRPVRVDWRVLGGTSEIMRYLESEYASACRAWWLRTGRGPWPAGAAAALGDATYASAQPPAAVATNPAAREAWLRRKAVRDAFHALDDPAAVSCGVDVLFGGGAYDHHRAFRSGLTVAPWPRGGEPPGLFAAADGATLIPEQAGGETWRTEAYFGTALSTFGICYNVDRLRELGIAAPPRRWADLADPAYVRQIGVGDPTKSGSLAKAFEMIIHEQCHARVLASGFDEGAIDALERHLAARRGAARAR